MTYTIEREDAAEDARVLRAAIRVASCFVPEGAEAMQRLAELADSIEEQVKPAIEEPTEWGSVVMARDTAGSGLMRWVRIGRLWRAENNDYISPWVRLTDVEVLRVGIGEAAPTLAEARDEYSDAMNLELRQSIAAQVLEAMDVDQYLIDAVRNAKPDAS